MKTQLKTLGTKKYSLVYHIEHVLYKILTKNNKIYWWENKKRKNKQIYNNLIIS